MPSERLTGVGELQLRRIEGDEGVATLIEAVARTEPDVDVRAGEAAARRVEGRARDARLRARRARNRCRPASPIPFSVVRFDSLPEPRIDAPPGPIVTFDIVPAIALRSPATVGEICPFTPSFHFSREPGSGSLGSHVVGRTHRLRRRHLHRGEHREVAREREVGDELALRSLPLHAPARGLEAGRAHVDEVVARALLEPRADTHRVLSVVVCCVSRSGPRVIMTVAPATARAESSVTRPRTTSASD